MEQALDVSIVFTETSLDSSPEALASIALHCEALSLSHLGNMLIDPLTQRERDDMRWYLEEYWKWPYLEFAVRGKQTEALLIDVGKRLYQAVFGSVEAQTIIQEWQKQPEARHQISIVSEIPRVLSLPWELLHDAHGFLALRPEHLVTIVRRLPLSEQSILSVPFEAPLRILLVTARPENASFIDPRSVARKLVDEIQTQVEAGTIDIEFLRPPTFEALHARLSDKERPIHILHFDGHGAFDEARYKQGVLLFETKAGWSSLVRASDLAKVLGDSGIRLVVLTACQSAVGATDNAFSSVAAQLMQNGVDAVVAMSGSILVASATLYVEAFYRELAAGIPVSVVQERARQALHDNPHRHVHHRRPDEEGMPIELLDWWLPHFYQQRLLLLQPTKLARHRNRQQSTSLPSRLSEEMPSETRYGFSGRARELFQLERWLGQRKLVVVSGFGGVGKTALVREIADWLTRTKMYDGACFVFFEHGGDSAMLLSALGNYLGIYDSNYDPNDHVATLARLKPILKRQRILLIADNLESILPNGEAPLDSEKQAQLWDVLLELAKVDSGVLLTSRNTNFGDERLNRASKVAHLQLQGLHTDDAYALATRLLDSQGIDREQTPYVELSSLLTRLDHHPLSIQLVLPALRERSLSTIQEEFTRLLPTFAENTTMGRNQSLLVSLNYSLQRLSKKQQKLLQRFVLFEGGANEDALLQIAEISEREWGTLRAMMEQTALLTVHQYKDISVPFLHFHPILIPFLRNHTDAYISVLNERYASYYFGLAQQLQESDRHNPQATRKLAHLEMPNLRHTLILLSKEGNLELVSIMAHHIAYFLKVFGRRWQLDEIWQQIVPPSPSVANALTQAEYIRESAQGDNEVEEGHELAGYTRFLTLLERIETLPEGTPRGRGSYEHCQTLARLANCLTNNGNLAAAEDYIRQAIVSIDGLINQNPTEEIFIRSRGSMLLLLGDSLREQGLYPQSQVAYQEGLKVFQQLHDLRSQDVALTQLGILASKQRDYSKARSYYMRALEIDRMLGEPEMEAYSWHYLGLVAEEQDEWTEAECCYRACLMLREQSDDIAGAASVCNNLALLSEATDRITEAENWLKRALDLDEKVHPGSYAHARSLQNFASLLLHEIQAGQASTDRLAEAKGYAERVLEMIEIRDTSMIQVTLSILKSMAELEDNQEAVQDYGRREREAYVAYEGNRHLMNNNSGETIVLILVAIMGNMQAWEVVVAVMKEQGEGGIIFCNAILDIVEGQRDWQLLVRNLGGFEALHLLRVLEILAEPMSIMELLPTTICKALEDGDTLAFMDTFEGISPDEQRKVELAIAFLYLSFQERKHSLNVADIALNFEPVARWFEPTLTQMLEEKKPDE